MELCSSVTCLWRRSRSLDSSALVSPPPREVSSSAADAGASSSSSSSSVKAILTLQHPFQVIISGQLECLFSRGFQCHCRIMRYTSLNFRPKTCSEKVSNNVKVRLQRIEFCGNDL